MAPKKPPVPKPKIDKFIFTSTETSNKSSRIGALGVLWLMCSRMFKYWLKGALHFLAASLIRSVCPHLFLSDGMLAVNQTLHFKGLHLAFLLERCTTSCCIRQRIDKTVPVTQFLAHFYCPNPATPGEHVLKMPRLTMASL